MNSCVRHYVVAWIVTANLLLSGCGPSGYSVSGTVTYNGEPVADGRVALRPVEKSVGARTVQAVIKDGNFAFSKSQKIPPGNYSVVITGRRKSGKLLPAEEGSDEIVEQYEQYLPSRYNIETELNLTVSENVSGQQFELVGP